MKNKLIIITLLFTLVIASELVSAASSVLLSDQGTDVRNKSGSLLEIGNLTITIYDNATGGNLIYNRTFPNIIANGSWNLMISPILEFGNIYWKDYSINEQDLDFDGIERINFQSPLGLINNVSFINFSLINFCPAGSSIRLIYENGSVECLTGERDNASWNESYADTLYTNKTGYNTTQFESVGGMVHIIESWFVTAWNNLFRNFFNQNLNTTSTPTFSNLTLTSGYISNGTDWFLIGDLNKTGTGMSSADVNTTILQYLNSGTNASYLTTYNVTYHNYATNVSKNWTEDAYNAWNTVWSSTYNATYAANMGNASWNESMAHTLFDSTFNATYAGYSANVSRNWTEDAYNAWNTVWSSTFNSTYDSYALNVSKNWTQITFDTYNTTWDDILSGNGDNSSWNESYANTLYTNKTGYNTTQFESVGGMVHIIESWLVNKITEIFGINFKTSFDANYTARINLSILSYLDAGTNASYLVTYNATYDLYSINVSKNWTQITFDTYNTTWDDIIAGMSSADVNTTILQYLNSGTNASYLTTYNVTYHNYATNVSKNWTQITFDTYNTTWDDIIAGMSSADVNTTILQYLNSGTNASYLTTYNVTYHNYATNVSKNWTEDAYNAWNTVWSSTYNATYAANMGNASWNESMAHTLFDSTFNATYAGYSANVSRNWTEDAYNAWNTVWSSTFNSTYDSYALNVSKNWTQITFDTYNTTWDDILSGNGDNSSWNESYANTLYTNKTGYNTTQFESVGGMVHIIESWLVNKITEIFGINFKTSFDANYTARINLSILSYLDAGTNASYLVTYNATYDLYSINVSKNWTQITFDTYNTTWDDIIAGMSSADVNTTILQYLNSGTNASYLTTYNVTYHNYATNVSKNWTQITFDTYNTTWDDIIAGMSSADVNTTILQYLNSGTNASYLTTYNVTYHNYATNVSKNWTEDAYNAWNTVWSSTYNATYAANMGNASWNESMAHTLFDSTFNATYAGYSANVSRNWTEDAYNAWNTVWSSTFNSTYDSYALNVSKNWTQITFDTYNTTWDDILSGNGDNSSWNESYANTLYTNKTGYNTTQFESVGGMVHIIESWLVNKITEIFGINFKTSFDANYTARINLSILSYLDAGTNASYLVTYNATYDLYSINVSKNWTQITFDTYNTTWDDIIAGMSSADVNTTILQYLNSGTNASYLTTYNVTYHNYATNVSKNWTQITFDTYNTTWDDIIAGMSSADVNTTILQYLNSGTNASYLTTYNVTYHNYATNVSKNWTEDAYNAWNTVWSSTYNATYAANMGNASWNESMAHTLFDSTFNATYAGYSANVSRNWTEDAYNAWNTVWSSTFNSTYDSYALNVSKNWTQITFDTYNTTWDDILSGNGDNSSWNESYANTLYTNKTGYNTTQFESVGGMVHIIESWLVNKITEIFGINFKTSFDANYTARINLSILSYLDAGTNASYLVTYNATYDLYSINVSKNWTQITFDTYNTTWDDIIAGMSSADVNTTILQYLNSGTNASYLTTYNVTYHNYATNVSKNWTQITFDTYNTTWDDIIAGMSSADVNTTILQYLNSGTNASYLTTYNVTYHNYATNVSKNWTEDAYNAWNTVWSSTYNATYAANMGNASWNESMAHTLFDSTFNATYAGYSANVSRNWTEDAYNAWNTVWSSTFNSTYDSYALNVSKNWTQITFDTYNTTWDDILSGNGDNSSWNESYANTLYTNKTGYNTTQFESVGGMVHIIESWLVNKITEIFGINFKTSFDANYTARINLSILSYLDAGTNASYLVTYNATYDLYSINVSKNWTQITFDTYNTTWDDIIAGMSSADVNTTILQYLNSGTNASYLTTYNVTYHNYATNVSKNWTQITFDTYNTTWDDIIAGMSSADVNTTILQYLNSGTNASYLTTYNVTYHNYATNVSKNWTEDAYNAWNTVWSSTYNATYAANMGNASWNESMAHTLFDSTFNATYAGYSANVSRNWTEDAYNAWNTVWSSTFNSTYDSYALNVSKNWTQITFDTYNTTWDDILSGNGDNSSWNESYANTLYTNKTGYNTTQFESVGGMVHIIESWLVNKITEIFGINFKTSFDANYTARINLSILSYLDAGTNESYLTTYNASYASFNSTENIGRLYNATSLLFAQKINTTDNIQYLLNSTGIYSIPLSINTTANIGYVYNSTALVFARMINTTANLQYLLNSTGIYSIPLSINTTANIGYVYNSTALVFARMINTTANLQYLLNSTGIYSIPLSINTTANIQQLINDTNMQFGNISFQGGGYIKDNGTTLILGHN